jgi:hypothetical protein
MSPLARVLVALAALLAAAALAGCGGGGGSTSETDFARNADNVCSDVGDSILALRKSRPRTEAEFHRYIDRVDSAVEDGIKRIQALDTPEGKAGTTARRFTAALAREYRTLVQPAVRQLERAVTERNLQLFQQAVRKLNALDKVRSKQLAEEIGASQCAATS